MKTEQKEKEQMDHQGERKQYTMAEQIPTAVGEGAGAERDPWQDCSPWRAHSGAEEKHEQEGKAGKNCDRLAATPTPTALFRVE